MARLLAYIFLCCSFVSFSQTTFQKTYPIFANAYGGIIEQTFDNGYLSTGAYLDTLDPNPVNIVVVEVVGMVKTDFAGNSEWIKTYNVGGQCAYGGSATQAADGSGYVYATVWADSLGLTSEVYLFKTDMNGIPVWDHMFGGIGYEYAMGITRSQDGGYCIAAYSDSHSPGYGDFYLIKTNSTGNMQWAYLYDHIGGYEFPMAMSGTADGGYVVIGTGGDTTSTTQPLVVLKVDSNGNIQFSKLYTKLNNYYTPYAIKQTSDHGYVFVGSAYENMGNTNSFVTKLDSLGNVMWTKNCGPLGTYYGDAAYGIEQTADDGYAVAIWVMDTINYTYKSGIMKLDAAGNVEWAKKYGTVNSYPGNIELTDDAGYCMVATNFNSYGMFLIKTDSTGNSNCNDTVISRSSSPFTFIVGSGMTRDTCGTQKQYPMTYMDIPPNDTVICEYIYIPPPPPPIPAVEVSIFVPNVYSPNGDNNNDAFVITTEGITELNCVIYDRWGLKIYELGSEGETWNGRTSSGKIVTDGVYYYLLKAKDANAKEYEMKGFIHLVR